MKHELTKGEVLVITGTPGCGKSTLARQIAEAYGVFAEVDASELNFAFGIGSALAAKPDTVILDGMPTALGQGKLKGMISSEEVTCDRQFRKPISVKSPNFIICTGDPDPIKLIGKDRRFRVIDISNEAKDVGAGRVMQKGVKGGRCNMTACKTPAEPASWYNHGSLAYYCEGCAQMLNNDSFNKREAQAMFGHALCTKEAI